MDIYEARHARVHAQYIVRTSHHKPAYGRARVCALQGWECCTTKDKYHFNLETSFLYNTPMPVSVERTVLTEPHTGFGRT